MKVHNKSVVKFEYVLKVDEKILERTTEGKSKTILMGHKKGLPPGLEHALLSHAAGESFTVKKMATANLTRLKSKLPREVLFPKR